MILHRLVAFPESRDILRLHLWATPFIALQAAVYQMLPVLLRQHFAADEWQTAISTAAISITLLLSVVWNELYCRARPGLYLTLLWTLAIAPLGGIALCYTAWSALFFIVVAATGFGGMQPLSGDILRNSYPPMARNRIFSVIQMVSQCTVMVGTYLIGLCLNYWPEAFRVYLPAGTLAVGVGMGLLYRITQKQLFVERRQTQRSEPLLTSLSRVYHNMLRVFREDSIFRRHETAFSLYGLGWMICWALLPFICVDKLQLTYAEVARSTQTVLQLMLMVTMLPTAYLMDRFGPLTIAAWSFALLIFYPIGLMWAHDVNSLTFVTIAYAVMLSGVNLTWTLGPILLARDASQAPTYLAIHATMVGIRGLVGQFPAVALYRWTQDFHLPLAIAAVLFAWGAVIMFRVERDRRTAAKARSEAEPMPLAPPP
ncbi:MAG: MFS transporter [Phycisphaerae bacterium]|nr:MFS transporter [Phycisphaerae bacterium]